jgi:hypothetical protein
VVWVFPVKHSSVRQCSDTLNAVLAGSSSPTSDREESLFQPVSNPDLKHIGTGTLLESERGYIWLNKLYRETGIAPGLSRPAAHFSDNGTISHGRAPVGVGCPQMGEFVLPKAGKKLASIHLGSGYVTGGAGRDNAGVPSGGMFAIV